MALNNFSPSTKIQSSKINANFSGLADGSLINDDAILERHISAQEDWVSPTLLNSWVNYGNDFNDAGYMKDFMGFVHFKGLVKNGTNTNGTILFTLPDGYRPLSTWIICGVASGNEEYEIRVDNSGNVRFNALANNTWASLDGMTFRAEQ